jgi:hypothetical protein
MTQPTTLAGLQISQYDRLHHRRECKEEKQVDVFGATSTTDEVLSGAKPQGKRTLVTPVPAGLGVETARPLVRTARIWWPSPDVTNAETATAQVLKHAAANGGSVQPIALDLAILIARTAMLEKLVRTT